MALNNWMSQFLPTTALTALSIPGTHDSCTATILNPPSSKIYDLLTNTYTNASSASGITGAVFAQSQNWTITQQLNNGIRFIDVRCRNFNGAFPIHHGPVFANIYFGDVLAQCVSFLKNNSSETIIMLVKEEDGGPTASFPTVFSNYMKTNVPSTTTPFSNYVYSGNSIPTLGAAKGKIVILKRFQDDSSSSAFGVPLPYALWGDNRFSSFNTGSTPTIVQDCYQPAALIVDSNDKLGYVRQTLNDALFNGSTNTLYLNYCSATNSISTAIIGYANSVNPALLNYLSLFGGYKANGIVIMDFPDNTPSLINAIINLNSKPAYSLPTNVLQSGIRLIPALSAGTSSNPSTWEVENGAKTTGSLVQLWDSASHSNKWNIVQSSPNTVKILNVNANLYVGTQNDLTSNGTKCCLVSSSDNSANFHVLPSTSDSNTVIFFTTISNFNSGEGYPLECENGNLGNSTKIQIWNSPLDRIRWKISK